MTLAELINDIYPLLPANGAILDYFENGYDITDVMGFLTYIEYYYKHETAMMLSISEYIGNMNIRCGLFTNR